MAMMSRSRQALNYYTEAGENKWCHNVYRKFIRGQIAMLRDTGLMMGKGKKVVGSN